MAKDGSSSSTHIRKITASKPLELHDQLMEWRDAAFQHLISKGVKCSEITLIYYLKHDLGPDHHLNSFMENETGYELAPNMKAQDVAISIINNYTEQKRREATERQQPAKDSRREAYLKALDDAYRAHRPFQPSARIQNLRAQANQVKATRSTYERFRQADDDLALADREEAREREAHFGLSPSDKFKWLASNSPEGHKAVEAEMRHHDMLHGSSSQSSDTRPSLIPPSLDELPYRSPEDMHGVNWLINYCVYRNGGFSREDVSYFRSLNMGPRDTPRQAAARVIRYADILAKAEIPGFNKQHELWSLLTTRDREGGPFFTAALYDYINPMIQTLLRANKLDKSNDERVIQLWVDTAEEQYSTIRGSDRAMFDKVVQEAQKRKDKGKNNNNDDKSKQPGKGDGGGKKDAKDTKDGKDKDKKGPNLDKNAGEHWCSEHGYNKSHTTAQCKVLIRRKTQAENEYNQAVKALTLISPPGADLSEKGKRPGARYAQGNPPQDGEHPAASTKVKCETCTRICGKPLWHEPGTCYMEPGVAVPEWFKPFDLARRKIVNEKRLKQGLPPLTDEDCPPPPPRKGTKAMHVVPADPTEPAFTEASYTCYMMGSKPSGSGMLLQPFTSDTDLGLYAHPYEKEEEVKRNSLAEHLDFVTSTRRFFCKQHRKFCTTERSPRTGDLLTIKCPECTDIIAASELPLKWSDPLLWRTDGSVLPALMQTPVRGASRGQEYVSTRERLESMVPLGPYGPKAAVASSSGSNQGDLVSRRIQPVPKPAPREEMLDQPGPPSTDPLASMRFVPTKISLSLAAPCGSFKPPGHRTNSMTFPVFWPRSPRKRAPFTSNG
jgi:hypothetical protein